MQPPQLSLVRMVIRRDWDELRRLLPDVNVTELSVALMWADAKCVPIERMARAECAAIKAQAARECWSIRNQAENEISRLLAVAQQKSVADHPNELKSAGP